MHLILERMNMKFLPKTIYLLITKTFTTIAIINNFSYTKIYVQNKNFDQFSYSLKYDFILSGIDQ